VPRPGQLDVPGVREQAGQAGRDLAAAGRALTEAEPRTFSELGALLAQRWPDRAPDALAQGVRGLVPLVQVPPRAVWGAAGQARHTPAEAWLGRPLAPGPSLPDHPAGLPGSRSASASIL
jgi:hypothetical protein